MRRWTRPYPLNRSIQPGTGGGNNLNVDCFSKELKCVKENKQTDYVQIFMLIARHHVYIESERATRWHSIYSPRCAVWHWTGTTKWTFYFGRLWMWRIHFGRANRVGDKTTVRCNCSAIVQLTVTFVAFIFQSRFFLCQQYIASNLYRTFSNIR